jgi:hypothetical protein
MSRSRGRSFVLLAALAGSTWLALFGDKTPAGVAVPVPSTPPRAEHSTSSANRAPGRAAEPSQPIEAVEPRAKLLQPAGDASVDLFAPAAWTLVARAPAPPPPPPAASAPAVVDTPQTLPHRVLGKKLEGQAWEVFLERDGTGTMIVRAGSTVEGQFRVERIEPPAMRVVHLPSGQTIDVPIGEAR